MIFLTLSIRRKLVTDLRKHKVSRVLSPVTSIANSRQDNICG